MISTEETRIGSTSLSGLRQVPAQFSLPRYRLLEVIGQGGMGTVYRAVDRTCGQPCAMKIPHDDSSASAERTIFDEVIALSHIEHTNIVRLRDFGHTEEGTAFLAMEWIAGTSLDAWVRRDGPLPARVVIPILRQLCAALAEVHRQGFAHRDIKPSNILWNEADESLRLIDFGLASPLESSEQATAADLDASFAGSPLFAPPEFSHGEFDHRSDIYSLGATAFFLLTGRPVFDETNPIAAIMAHAQQQPESVANVQPEISPELAAMVMTCLAKEPDRRFPTVQHVDAALTMAQRRENTFHSSCRTTASAID